MLKEQNEVKENEFQKTITTFEEKEQTLTRKSKNYLYKIFYLLLLESFAKIIRQNMKLLPLNGSTEFNIVSESADQRELS